MVSVHLSSLPAHSSLMMMMMMMKMILRSGCSEHTVAVTLTSLTDEQIFRFSASLLFSEHH